MGKEHGNFFRNKIALKVMLPTIILIGLFVFPAAVAWNGMKQVRSSNEEMRNYSRALVNLHLIETSMDAERDSKNALFDTMNSSNSPEEAETFIFLQSSDTRSIYLQKLEHLAPSGKVNEWLSSLKALNARLLNLSMNEMLPALNSSQAEAQATSEEFDSIHHEMQGLVALLVQHFESLSSDTAVSSNNDAASMVKIVIFIMVLASLLGLSLAMYFTRKVAKPAVDLADAAKELSRGNLEQKLEVNGNDELAELGRAFNNMASSLNLRTDALTNERNKLRSVHQSITDGLVVYGNNGFVISANPAAEAILSRVETSLAGSRKVGIRPLDEIMQRDVLVKTKDMAKCWELNNCGRDECPSYGSDDRRCWLQCGTYCHDEIQDSFKQKRDACERCPVYRKNGCTSTDTEVDGRCYSISVAPILDEEGQPEGRLAVLHDMTDERIHSKQLNLLYRLSNTMAMTEDLDSSLKQSLEICINEIDATGGFITLIDENNNLINAAEEYRSHITDKDKFKHDIKMNTKQVINTGKAILMNKENVISELELNDGIILPLKENGKVIGVLGFIEKDTREEFNEGNMEFLKPVAVQFEMALSRTRLHMKVTEEQEKSTAIIESMDESICVRSPDRKILFANRTHKEIFGDDCIGKYCYELYHGRTEICSGCPMTYCFDKSTPVRRSHFVFDKTGNQRRMETTAMPLRDPSGNITSCMEVGRDVTEMLEIRDQARSRLETLTKLFSISKAFSSSLDMKNIVDNYSKSVLETMDASTVCVGIFDEDIKRLVVSSIAGDKKSWQIEEGDKVKFLESESNRISAGTGPFCITSYGLTKNHIKTLAPPGTQEMLVGRLSSRGKIIGLIAVCSPIRRAFNDKERIDLFIDVTNQASIAIDNAISYERLEETFWSTIRSLAEAIDAKDAYTRGHSDRVAGYAESLARKLNLSQDEIHAVKCAGYLHDIGKIGVPDAILNKPGKLSEDERIHIMSHPALSHKIIEPVKFPFDVKPLVRHHHERIDGTGYPDRIKGDKVPLGARIIGIADAFEAMTSDRPYRDALSFDAALAELKKCSGTQFDAYLVGVFEEIILEYRDAPAPADNDAEEDLLAG